MTATNGHPTMEARREALHFLAEQVAIENRYPDKTVSNVLPLVVPTLVAAVVVNPLGPFNSLVGAVEHYQDCCDRGAGSLTDAECDVTYWLDVLCGQVAQVAS